MNNVTLVGRLTKDPETRQTQTGMQVARFTVAVDRSYKTENGKTADFIPCIAFGKTADFIGQFFLKGRRIGLSGRIQTDSYVNKEGKTVYTTDVVVDRAEFVDSLSTSRAEVPKTPGDDFIQVPDDVSDDELPFN